MRSKLIAQLVMRYESGTPIHTLAKDIGKSRWWVRDRLVNAGVTIRPRYEATRLAQFKHGMSGSYKKGIRPALIYKVWTAMIERCERPTHHAFDQYGGRGINVCARWRYDFQVFMNDMGPRPDKHVLDRIDNDGNYTPENCRWATKTESTRNRRNALTITVDGVQMHVKEAIEKYGAVSYGTMRMRLRVGWPPLEALYTPSGAERRSTPIN